MVLRLRYSPYRPPLVKERSQVDRAFGRAAFVVELAKGPAEAFSPLKAVLASISGLYAQHQVSFDALFEAPLTITFPEHCFR